MRRCVFAWRIMVPGLLVIAWATGCATQKDSHEPTRAPPSPGTDTVLLSALPSLRQVVDAVLPSVVYVLADPAPGTQSASPRSGSGIVLRPDGYILTNKHVVQDAATIEVTLYDRRSFKVTDVWNDPVMDLSVVKIEGKALPVAQFGDPSTIGVGDWVLALGHALGLSPGQGGATVTLGIVSNLGRSFSIDDLVYYDLIQTDAAINHGNSGGPLVNLQGHLIGVNSVLVDQAQSIGYAINVATARHIFEDLVEYGVPRHPFLGIKVEDPLPALVSRMPGTHKSGAVITNVKADSPAERIGLRENDVILSLASQDVESAATVLRELWRHEVGDVVDVVIWRDGKEQSVRITLGENLFCGHL